MLESQTTTEPSITITAGEIAAVCPNLAVSFSKNQGNFAKTVDHYGINLVGGKFEVRCDGIAFTYPTFQNFLQRFALLDSRDLLARDHEQLKKLAVSISEGATCANHSPYAAPELDKLAPVQHILDSIGVSKVERNGKGSKMYLLFMPEVNREYKTILETNGFASISPILNDDFEVIGLKCELPKI